MEKRNAAIELGKQNDYYIDENFAKKCWNIFEEPLPNEIDVWYKNDWS